MSDGWDKWYRIDGASPTLHNPAPQGRSAREPLNYLLALFLLGIFATIAILGWQIYGLLRHGEWPALSMIGVLQRLNVEWARLPHDWVGLHDLLDAIPLSVVVFFSGLLPIGTWFWRDERADTKQPVDWGG